MRDRAFTLISLTAASGAVTAAHLPWLADVMLFCLALLAAHLGGRDG